MDSPPSISRRHLLLAICLGLLASVYLGANASDATNEDHLEAIEVITFKDQNGLEHEEFAFRAPMRGVPEHVINMYCASVKLRLYWGVYREQVLDSARKGIYLRRMARLARHIFDDVKDVDDPFNAPRLSIVDEYFAVDDNEKTRARSKVDGLAEDDDSNGESGASGDEGNSDDDDTDYNEGPIVGPAIREKLTERVKNMVKLKKLTSSSSRADEETALESSESFKELEKNNSKESIKRLKALAKKWAPKVALTVYTRWRTLWWMMLSCLFTKYYLWDPALDEFIKLKRNLVMYPDFQLLKLQDISCKPVKFFQRILDVCKILNPIFHIDFGTLSLDNLTRFKSDRH